MKKEAHKMQNILSKYNLTILDIEKTGFDNKISTDRGYIALRKTKKNKNKILMENIISKELRKNNFTNTKKYFETHDGYLFVKNKNSIFYTEALIDGQYCDFNNLSDACKTLQLLAKFHLAGSNINHNKLSLKNNLSNLPKEFSQDLVVLEKCKRILHRKKVITEFDTLYEKYIDELYKIGVTSLNFVNSTDYYKLVEKANRNKTICLNKIHANDFVKNGSNFYIVNLNNAVIDIRANDIGNFIRKLMYKDQYKWDFNKGKTLINAYNKIDKLDKNEIYTMLPIILFPHKFCKLGYKKYIKHKKWSDDKYLKKLMKLVKFVHVQQVFLNKYIEYAVNYK